VVIAAFEGWNDAAEAASGVVNHLGIAWKSTPIAAIDPDDYYDFQVNRPVIEVNGGKTEPSSSCTGWSRTCAGAGSPRN
jgi:hypothetical protein